MPTVWPTVDGTNRYLEGQTSRAVQIFQMYGPSRVGHRPFIGRVGGSTSMSCSLHKLCVSAKLRITKYHCRQLQPVSCSHRLHCSLTCTSCKACISRHQPTSSKILHAKANCVFITSAQDGNGDLPSPSDLSSARSSQRSGNAIPVIAAAASSSSPNLAQQVPALSGPADGFCLPLEQLVPAAAAVGGGTADEDSSAVAVAVGALLQALTEGHTAGW
jgi:hypothetical protein